MKNFDIMDTILSNTSNGHIFKLSSGDVYHGFIKNYQFGSPFLTLQLAKCLRSINPYIIVRIEEIVEVTEA